MASLQFVHTQLIFPWANGGCASLRDFDTGLVSGMKKQSSRRFAFVVEKKGFSIVGMLDSGRMRAHRGAYGEAIAKTLPRHSSLQWLSIRIFVDFSVSRVSV